MTPLTSDDADIPSHPNRLMLFIYAYLLTLGALAALWWLL